MSDTPPLHDADVLDAWEDDERTPRHRSARLIGPLALVAVGAIVVAVVLGGTKSGATNPVTTPTTDPSRYQISTVSPTAWQSPTETSGPMPSGGPSGSTTSTVSVPSMPPLVSDDPAEPLRITLLDPTPVSPTPGVVAYRVQVCVSANSAGVSSDKVRVRVSNWQLMVMSSTTGPQSGQPVVNPQFPVEVLLGKGECVSGYVSFAWNFVESPESLWYSDGRFGWYWRLR